MLNDTILRYITLKPTPHKPVKSLAELAEYKTHQWIWTGAYTNNKRHPTYKNQQTARLLYKHFITDIPNQWRLSYPHNNKSDVNPFKLKVANGYSFTYQVSDDVADLLEAIPQYVTEPHTLDEVHNLFHQLYSKSDIEQAYKMLGKSFKCTNND